MPKKGGDTMSTLLDEVKERTKKDADEFIDMIKSNEIRKRVLPNESADFPEDIAFESFDHFTKSKEFDKIIKETYQEKMKK